MARRENNWRLQPGERAGAWEMEGREVEIQTDRDISPSLNAKQKQKENSSIPNLRLFSSPGKFYLEFIDKM